MIISLGPYETKTIHVAGSHFYYEKGDHSVDVRIMGNDGRTFDSMKPGQGFRSDERFSALEFRNGANAQDVEFVVSYRELFDNRAMFSSSSASIRTVVENGPESPVLTSFAPSVARVTRRVVVPANVATKLLDADAGRTKAALHFMQDCYLGSDDTVSAANGFPMSEKSDWVDENNSELWLFASVPCTVCIMEDRR